MFHRFRIPSFLAAVFATLVLAPAAFADGGITPDNRADRIGPAGTVVQIPMSPDNRADRIGPAGLAARQAVGGADIFGLPARSAPTSGSDSGFDWFAAAIGAVSAFAV